MPIKLQVDVERKIFLYSYININTITGSSCLLFPT